MPRRSHPALNWPRPQGRAPTIEWAERASNPGGYPFGPLPPGVLRVHGVVEGEPVDSLRLTLDGRAASIAIPIDERTRDVFAPVLVAGSELVVHCVITDSEDHLDASVSVVSIALPEDANRGASLWPPMSYETSRYGDDVIGGFIKSAVPYKPGPRFELGYDIKTATRMKRDEAFRYFDPADHAALRMALQRWKTIDEAALEQHATDMLQEHPILEIIDDGKPTVGMWCLDTWEGPFPPVVGFHPHPVKPWRNVLEGIWGVNGFDRHGMTKFPAWLTNDIYGRSNRESAYSFRPDDVTAIGRGQLAARSIDGVENPEMRHWAAISLARFSLPGGIRFPDLEPWCDAGFSDPRTCLHLHRTGLDPNDLVKRDPAWRRVYSCDFHGSQSPNLLLRYTRGVSIYVWEGSLSRLAQLAQAAIPLPEALSMLPRARDLTGRE
ncbi:hypothetical protein [Terrabacter sp. 2RAF25]|uniref:hypothetical protein n=1 Tax=Terrabacter sp. 2RAF25 TaxID=3232998 RepID=UPI003F9DBA82